VRSLGRTIVRWRDQIVAWHRALVSNGPTEAINNLIKRIKRVSVNRPSEPDVLGVRAVVAIGWGHWCCAHAWRWAMWVERTDGGYRIEGGPPVEGALANGLLSRLETRSFSPLTVRAYAFHVLSFLRFCDEQGLALASVTPMDLFDFLDWLAKPAPDKVVYLRTGRGASPATMNQRIAALRGLFEFAVLTASDRIVRSRRLGGLRGCGPSVGACWGMSRRVGLGAAAGWSGSNAGCRRRWSRSRSPSSSPIWRRIGTGRSCWRCCWAGCEPARSARCASPMSMSAPDRCG
jgi:hypothetical protein